MACGVFMFAAATAFGATFSNVNPANGAILGDPDVNATVTTQFRITATVTPGQTFAAAPNPDYALGTLKVDDGVASNVGLSYAVTGWDDSEMPIYDYSQATLYTDLTLTTNQQHTIVFTITELPSNTPYTFTWVVGQTVRPDNCQSCHPTYPASHPMTNCAGCHFAGGPANYHNAAFPSFGTCGRGTCHGVSSHGPDRLGAHTYYDLDGNPSERAAIACGFCHNETRFASIPSHGDVAGSFWSYKDLADSNAKYEGGYECASCHDGQPNFSPHGGYDTATNKCKVCHAVHRAEGAYYLLRADSQDDACEYCHLGSAHSATIVYDNGGIGSSNGHTIGASSYIPDSTVAQWTEEVALRTTAADGTTIEETVRVRAYAEQKNDMYRFARHHGHQIASGTARRNYVPVGPLALRCMNCHQVHNATYQTWQSISDVSTQGAYTGSTVSSYKLLKQSPSGTFYGALDAYGQVPVSRISMVPETTLTAGYNYEDQRSEGASPTTLSGSAGTKITRTVGGTTASMQLAAPLWVAQSFDGEHDRNAAGAEQSIASAVNNFSLSVWCADCHNLNIGGWKVLENEELGFKSHPERTHPAPFTGAHSGPGQCYTCHRADLPRVNSGDACSQCHYGTGNYRENRKDPAAAEYVASDFPHTGDGSYKMLGNYSVVMDGTDLGRTTTTTATVGPENLDAVCVRCHGGVGTYH